MSEHPTKPPFSYYGGKQRLAARICSLLPPHTVYVEPFCGSAAVYFKKGLPVIGNSDHYREVLNDTDQRIVNFFRVMQDPEKRAALIDRLEWTVYSQDEYKLAKSSGNQLDMVNIAWRWFCNVNWSFSKNAGNGFSVASYGKESSSVHYNSVQRLKEYRDRFKCTSIMNEPALKVIERFDSPHTCFYVDPPYPDVNQGHYEGFTQANFEELIDRLKQCHGAVVLSCYNNTAVPANWVKHEFHAVASSARITGKNRGISEATNRDKDKRVECVWVKPASSPMRENLVPVAQRNWEQLQFNFADDLELRI